MKTNQDAEKGTPKLVGSSRDLELGSSLYRDLQRLAIAKMRFERTNHTLQPSALVNEAYLRLRKCGSLEAQDRPNFMRLAARVMRNILIDHARHHSTERRGGQISSRNLR